MQTLARWTEKYGDVIRVSLGEREAVGFWLTRPTNDMKTDMALNRFSSTATRLLRRQLSSKDRHISHAPRSSSSTVIMRPLVSGLSEVSLPELDQDDQNGLHILFHSFTF